MRPRLFAALLVGACCSSLAQAQSAPPASGTQSTDPAESTASGDTTPETDDPRIPDIIVTADRFAKSVQKTPLAVSVVTGDQITKEGRTKIDDVLKNEPAVIVQGAAKGFLVSIRGLGLSLPPQLGQGAVATNYDGAFSSRAENASAGFYDLDRVEVLRGPQSTLYGRNAVGGVVNIVSRDPRLDGIEGYASGEVGNYDLFHGEGAINVPLGTTVALRVAGAGITRDGYMSNGHDDNKAYAGRAKLLFQPRDAIKLVLGAEYTHLGGKGPGAVPIASVVAGDRDTTDVSFGYQDVDYYKFWGTLNAEIGPGVLFVEPSYQHTRGRTLGAFGGNFANAADPKRTRQKSLEIRYSSLAGSAVEWNVGYYHYDNHNVQQTISGACEDTAGNFVVPPPGFNSAPPGPPGPAPAGACLPADQAVPTSYNPEFRNSFTDGIFGQVTIPLAERFRVIAGARYTWERLTGFGLADADAQQFKLPTQKDGHFDYRAGLEFDLASSSLLYATVASGYRQGGFAFGGTPYAPEEMRSYELGLKNRIADGRVLLNGTVFYYDYDSFQLVVADFSGPLPRLFVPTMPAREFGAELETAISIGTGGRLNASLTYLDSRLAGVDGFYIGLPFPTSPKWQFKAGYQHAIDLGGRGTITPRADFRTLSRQLVFPEQTAQPDSSPSVQRAYATGDLSIIYSAPGDRFSVTAYLKNVNDKIIKQSHFFGYAQLAAPRTYGLVGTFKF